ncbi:MAG: hypothetical protein Q8P63_01440 [Candidatus Nealsonbacteria bacterium]|nr:hypothetical protein [Candidatus Nealsonbacteria bacterium]
MKKVNEGNICTARVTRAWLNQPGVLQAEITSETEFITTGQERRDHFNSASKSWLQRQLQLWQEQTSNSVKVAAPGHPLEIICGDCCLILKIEGIRYIVSTYRDIMPQGWLIPGGVPDNIEQLFSPKEIAEKEVAEEILIGDIHNRVYFLQSRQETEINIEKWGLKPTAMIPLSIKELTWKNKGDAQTLLLKTPDRQVRLDDVVIFIDPEIASAVLTLYWEIEIPFSLKELRLFDGESHWEHPDISLNRVIRLVPVGREKPVAIFSSGQNILGEGWITETTKKQALQEKS